jgi:hypothetical protein
MKYRVTSATEFKSEIQHKDEKGKSVLRAWRVPTNAVETIVEADHILAARAKVPNAIHATVIG